MEYFHIKQINEATTQEQLMDFLEKIYEIIKQTKLPNITIIAGCLIALRDRGQDLSEDWTFDKFAIYMSRLQSICDNFETCFPNQNVWIDYECSNIDDSDD